MPWRAPYLRYRRHPIAIATYLVVALLGFLLLTNVAKSSSSVDAITPWFIRLSWQCEMAAGGLTAAVASFMPARFLAGSLRAESAGAFLCACGLVTYSIAVQSIVGWASPGWVLFFTLAGGCLWRAVQVPFDERRLRRVAEQLSTLPGVDGGGR
jgi:hypothetical protein